MILISCYCRGLVQASVGRALKALIGEYNFDCISLMETKLQEGQATTIVKKFGFDLFVTFPSVGSRGGLLFLWRLHVPVHILGFNQCMISAFVRYSFLSLTFVLTLVYDPSCYHGKRQFWDSLDGLAKSHSEPWAIVGDFNAITTPSEKLGGHPFASSSFGGLRGFINSCGLVDMGFHGNSYTWTNGRQGCANIKERIDRGLANQQWRTLFSNATILHIPSITSDHLPLLLNKERFWADSFTPF